MKAHPLSEAQFTAIADLVRTRTGLTFGPSRREQAESAIRQAMANAGGGDANRFVTLVHGNERALQSLVECLTVAETYFFRDREQFEVLRRNVLPQLLQAPRHGEPMRFWSAGCATGEEPYSVAMLLDREGLAERATIVATDISRPALSLARKASYGAWSFRDTTPDIAEHYFDRRGDRLVLIERVRRMVEFDLCNLASESYPFRITGPTGLDVILCRNVLIYFDADTVARVARQLFAALRDGGWLITGPSDPPLWPHAPYETMLTPAGVLYRRVDAAAQRRARPASGGLAEPRHRREEAANVICATAPPPRRSCKPTDQAPPRQKSPKRTVRPPAAGAHRDSADNSAVTVAAALSENPLSAELHYLRAMVLMEGGRYEEAAALLRGALYLDRSMAVAHFALGSVQARRGAIAAARRSFQNVLMVCGGRHGDEIVPFSDGEQTGRLIEAARTQLACIGRRA